MNQILTDNDRGRLDALVADTEKQTNTQIVLAVIRRSDSYAELPWKAFALGASVAGLLVFILNLSFNDWYPQVIVLLAASAILASGTVFAFLTILNPGFARCFLSAHRAEVEVGQYAESMFLNRELFATSSRTGILLLVSLFERKVVILPDKGLCNQLTEEKMQSIIASMTQFLKKKEVYRAFEAGLKQLSGILKSESQSSGENELPDEIIEEKGV